MSCARRWPPSTGTPELYKMQRDMPGALERADESIAHIEASSSRMTVLVEDLLSLARLDEGRGIDITQQVNLTAIVKDAADGPARAGSGTRHHLPVRWDSCRVRGTNRRV